MNKLKNIFLNIFLYEPFKKKLKELRDELQRKDENR